MAVNLSSLHELCEDKVALLEKLQEWNLIPRTLKCIKCGGSMSLRKAGFSLDGWIWRCRHKFIQREPKAKKCENMVSLRTGTFFARSKLPIFKILAFVNLWVGNVKLLFIQEQLEISKQTSIDWASFCRKVLLTHFMHNKMKLGGPGVIVEIDESKFGQRKYHKEKRVKVQCVFSVYERGTGRVFMVSVNDRGADTLVPLIQDWIEPGTTIMSDFWKSYDCLGRSEYDHLKVQHSFNFVDPDSSAHTNSIEGSSRAAKAVMSSAGRKKAHIPGNLARYMFYKKCAELKLNRTFEFYRLAGEVYKASLPILEEEEEIDMDDLDIIDDMKINIEIDIW